MITTTIPRNAKVATAWAGEEVGPGWKNSVVWVIVQMPDMTYQLHSLQQEQLSAELATLSRVSDAINTEMVNAVNRLLRKIQ